MGGEEIQKNNVLLRSASDYRKDSNNITIIYLILFIIDGLRIDQKIRKWSEKEAFPNKMISSPSHKKLYETQKINNDHWKSNQVEVQNVIRPQIRVSSVSNIIIFNYYYITILPY